MSFVERATVQNGQGYEEVAMDYRIARAAMLEERKVNERTGRIPCPMLDASRTDAVYGQNALPGVEGKDLKAWADALGTSSIGIKMVAYLSGPASKIPAFFARGRFDDQALATGFIRSLKNGTNTGVLAKGVFDQGELDRFISNVRPDLGGQPMSSDWIYSDASAEQYLDRSMLPKIREHNTGNSGPGWLKKKVGLTLSTFEMKSLLLGVLAQKVPMDPREPSKMVEAILLRDVHDLYKYACIPAVAENRLHAAGLLDFPKVPLSA